MQTNRNFHFPPYSFSLYNFKNQMALKRKTWVKEHIDRISEFFSSGKNSTDFPYQTKQINEEQKLYRTVQPTGLMYGHPVKPVIDYGYKMKSWDDKEKMKLIITDTLMHQKLIKSVDEEHREIRNYLTELVDDITDFYQNELLTKKIRPRTWWGRKRTNTEILDLIIERRLKVNAKWRNHFWANFFNNSMLFLDVYLFGKWISTDKDHNKFHEFRNKQKRIRINLLKLIAASAYANKIIEKEERKLFDFFLNSASLEPLEKKEAKSFIDSEMSLEDIDFSDIDDWILKKYFLEMGILTIWADRLLEDSEKNFVHELAKKLGFTESELEGSMLAIESFVLTNWENVHFLRQKKDFNIVKEGWQKRMSLALHKNKHAIAQEIKESKELMQLLKKQKTQELTEEEKKKVHAQLIDVLKTIPAFVIIALPFTFITLPVLISILPPAAFPSAFTEEDEE